MQKLQAGMSKKMCTLSQLSCTMRHNKRWGGGVFYKFDETSTTHGHTGASKAAPVTGQPGVKRMYGE